MNWLSQVGRMELEGDNIQVTLLLPSVTDTEFYCGRLRKVWSRTRPSTSAG